MHPTRKDGVEIQDLPDGSALLYDTESATAYPVTGTAAVAWKALDGEHSVEEIVAKIEAAFDAERSTIEADLDKLLADLESRGLLQASAAE